MKKVVFVSILIATILAGGVFALSIWKATPLTAQAFYDSGKQFYDAQKYPEATIQLLNAVRKEPNHRNARYWLALSYIAQQDFANAVRQLRGLLEYYPDDTEAELKLGNLYLTGGRANPDMFREAQILAEKVLARESGEELSALRQANKVAALILSGNAAAGLQHYQDSVDLFEQAIDLDPGNLSALVGRGTTQALLGRQGGRDAQKNFSAAEQAFLKARQVDPKDKNALLSLGNFYRAVGEPAKAETILKEGLALFPTDKDIYLQAVSFYVREKRFADAETLLRSVQGKVTNDPSPSLVLVELLTSQERPADVRKLLLSLKEQYPKNINVAVKLALNLLQDQPERARKEIDQIRHDEPENPIGHVLLGESQFFSGQIDDAEATLGKNPALDSPYPQAHFFLGNIALRKGLIDQAIFHYQKSLAVQSKYVPSRIALAEVFLGQGKVADSREEVRKALEVRPEYAPARILKATLDRGDKNYAEAERELSELAKEQPGSPFIQRQMALYNESRGRNGDAEKNLTRAQEIQPDSPEVFRDLILLYLRSKQTDKALQKISDVPDNKKQAYHYELEGLAYAQANKMAEAEKSFKKALQKDPSRMSSNLYLFAGYIKEGKLDEGMKKLDEVITQTPDNASAIGVKALMYERQGKIDEAKRQYNEALKRDPNAVGPANNLAWLLAEEGSDLNTALGLAQMARKKDPDNPGIADTLGWVYHKLGNHVLAREQLRFAVSRAPQDPVIQYHLGLTYKETKQYSEARTALERATASKTDFKERSLAQAALKEIANLK